MSVKSPQLPDYQALQNALTKAGLMSEPSELQGSFCGSAILLGPHAGAVWLKDALEDADTDNVLVAEGAKQLGELALNSFRMLEEGEMAFNLLLPGDDEPIDTRTRALAYWCQGFLHGLATAAGGEKDSMERVFRTPLAKEILADFSEITKAGTDPDDAEADHESSFVELVEYVRVSVQLLFEESADLRGDGKKLDS